MKKIITIALLANSTLFAYDMGVNVSTDTLHISESNSNIILGDNTPDDKATGLEVYVKNNCLLLDNPSIKNYVSFKQSKTTNTKTNEIFLGLQKEYTINNNSFYASVLAGYGTLSYDYNPLNSTTKEDKKASSFLYGLEIGTKSNLESYKNTYIQVGIRHIESDYKTNLESNSVYSTITHDGSTSLLLGLGYSF